MKAATPLRIARWLLLVISLPALLYLVGGNLFLNFGLPLAFKSTNSVNATLKSAWTVWPGVVHVNGARIVFQDHNLQWSLDLEQARVKLALRELLQQTFHAREVTGSGAVFRMRHRIPPESKGEPWVSTLPPIPEFPAPAVFEARVPEAPVTDDNYNLWTVHLENVDVGVREFWTHFVRFQGTGSARGAFRLRPARTLWVGPASLTLERGKLTLGGDTLAKNLSGAIRCTVHPFDVRAPQGREVFRFISTDLDLRAEGVTPDPAVGQFFADSGLGLDTVPGTLRVSARVKRGNFSEGSLLELQSPGVRANFRDFGVEATGVTAEMVARPNEQLESSLRFVRAQLVSSKVKPETAPALIERAELALLTSGLDAAGEAELRQRKLSAERVDIPDARLLNAFAAGKLRFSSGKVEVALRSSEQQGALEAEVHGAVRKLRVGDGRAQLALDGQFKGGLQDGDLKRGTGRVNLNAVFASVRLNDLTKGGPQFVLDEARKLTLSTHVEREASGRTRTDLQLSSAGATLARLDGVERKELARFEALELKGVVSQTRAGLIDAKINGSSREARALLGSTWVRARARLALELFRFDPERRSGEAQSELNLERGSALTMGGSDCPWATLPTARMRSRVVLQESKALATVHAALGSTHLSWGDFRVSGRAELDARIQTQDLDSSRGTLKLYARAHEVTLNSGAGDEKGWQAELPNAEVSLELDSDEKVSGEFALTAPKNKLRIGGTHLQTDFRARTLLTAIDVNRQEARFSGHFAVRNARLTAREQQIDGWWADVHADSALIIARDNLDLSLPFRAKLRDGEPGMAILVEKGSLPSLIADAVPLRSVEVVGTVQRRCRLTNIRFTEATGGPLFGRGSLNSTSDGVRGAFLLRLNQFRAISAGVALDSQNSEASGVSLFAGDDWLRGQTEALDAHTRQVLDAPCLTPPAECSGESEKTSTSQASAAEADEPAELAARPAAR